FQHRLRLALADGDAHASVAFDQTTRAGVFADDDAAGQPHLSRIETFVVMGILDDAVGVQAGFMSKDPLPDHRFGDRQRAVRGLGNEERHLAETVGIDAGFDAAGMLQPHHHLFQGSVTGPLSEPVDGGVDIFRPGADAGYGICGCHAEIVMRVDFYLYLWHRFSQKSYPVVHAERVHDPECVAETEAVTPERAGDLHQLHQKVYVGPAGVFSSDRYVQVMTLGEIECHLQLLLDRNTIFAQLIKDHLIRNRKRNINSLDTAGYTCLNFRHKCPVPGNEPGVQSKIYQRPDTGTLFITHCRDTAFDLLNPYGIEHSRNGDLLPSGEYYTCGLLTITKGCVVYYHSICHLTPPKKQNAPEISHRGAFARI